MHVIRLRLSGFKSFVDPTELSIAEGLTGVVGPNGCGKSNLLEAIRWVMGESRASAVRGEAMEDVIFAGAAARPARNHAEVTLTLDNRDRRAPAGFNDADTLEIVRRITRDAGSAYRVGGREARARDVALLFADASTGAQSPALVRQGQIAELVSARPKARRRVLEEAAGIAGLHQRRHEAELKLGAAETNLGRVGDVLEALEVQLAALVRQSRQAVRYREVASSLRRSESMLLLRLWRDADAERAAAAAALLAATRAAAHAEAAAAEAARQRDAADAAISPAREEDAVAGAILQRATQERERLAADAREAARRIAEFETALAQLAADRRREAILDRDAAQMDARLTAERAEITAAVEGHEAAQATTATQAAEAVAGLEAIEAAFDARAEAAARASAEHHAAATRSAEAERRAADLARALDQAERGLAAAEAEVGRAVAARAAAADTASRTAAAAKLAEDALTRSELATFERRSADAAARAALAEADGTAKAIGAEAAQLERLLARPEDAGAQIDQVRVAPGYEAALGAALADDLALPAIAADGSSGVDAPSREALEPSGWIKLPPLEPATLPAGAARLDRWVDAPEELFRPLAATGLVDRADGARLQPALGPGQQLVSQEGDLWRWDGLRLAAGAVPGAAAQRLRQVNRLVALGDQRSALNAAAAAARTAQVAASRSLAEASQAEAAARTARRDAETAMAEAGRALTRAESASEMAVGRAEGLRAGRARRAAESGDAEVARAAARRIFAGLADPTAAKAALAAERLKVEAARLTMLTRRAEVEELERAATARQRRLAEIARELDTWRRRRAAAADRLEDLARRETDAGATLLAARAKPASLAAQGAALATALAEAEARRRRAAEALAAAEAALRDRDAGLRAAERAASEAREARARAEAQTDSAELRAAEAVDRLRAAAEAEPAELMARLDVDPTQSPATAELEAEIHRLRRARDALGAVNLRAEADAAAVRSEFDALAAERADLEEAISKLRLGVANLNREGRGRLIAAFDEVNRNFSALFRHLFGGGEASLALVESDDPLEAGLEIMCQPPGKKLSTLSLLSGGEQTLTALALIFAVFLANPSPICVLDEVDAPLDDANVGRFCDLLDEMTARTDTRFLIITHHAVTMSRMDRLFGVTMAERGVSQLVSVDLAATPRVADPVA